MLVPFDVLYQIFAFVTPATYKEVIRLSTHLYTKYLPFKHAYCNELWTFIEKHPEKCSELVSTLDGIVDHPTAYKGSYVKNHWETIVANPNTTLKILEKLMRGIVIGDTLLVQCGWKYACKNPNVTMEFINKHPPHTYSSLTYQPVDIYGKHNHDVGLEVTRQHNEILNVWRYLSMHSNITIDDICSHPQYPWVWDYVVCNPNVTYEDIKMRFPHDDALLMKASHQRDMRKTFAIKPYYYVNKSNTTNAPIIQNVTMKDIILNENVVDSMNDGAWKLLGVSKGLTYTFLEKYIDKPWDWVLYISISLNRYKN